MTTVMIDYDSGNLHSAQKAFERMARETNAGEVIISRDPQDLRRADRIVLPGDGAFPHCRSQLFNVSGMAEALTEAVERDAKPFLGICVGMQMLAQRGFEHEETQGFGWVNGEIHKITPSNPAMPVPHMGWNDLVITQQHPVLDGLKTGDHAYFVHSWQMIMADPAQRLAHCDYGGDVTAIVGQGTVLGTQFHPEKSQAAGLRLIANFLKWTP